MSGLQSSNARSQRFAGRWNEEWGEIEKDWVEEVGEKKMAAVFSYDRARGSR